MIVTCPACDTRYLVDDEALGGAAGRRVRCASCGNVWHYSPEAAAIQQSIAEVTAEVEAAAAARPAPQLTTQSAAPSQVEASRPEPTFSAQPHPAGPTVLSRPAMEIEVPGATQRRRARVAIVWAALLAIAVVAALVGARDRIMALYPEASPVYETLRLAEPPGAGLKVSVSPSRTADSLVIDGDIVNTAAAARRVPRLRVSLRDGNKVELEAKVIDPPAETLAPGATARFNTVFEHPSITATGVEVTFAP